MALFTYSYPVSGTTPPTLAQMNVTQNNAPAMVVGRLSMADSDTTIAVVHNFQQGQNGQAQLLPLVIVTQEVLETADPFLTVVRPTPSATPNTSVQVNKNAGAGTGFTAVVFMLRPHTLIR